MTLYPKLITDALATVRYPGSGKNIIEAEMLDDNLRIDGNHVSFSLIFPKNPDPFMKSVVKAAEAAIKQQVGPEAEVEITALPYPKPSCCPTLTTSLLCHPAREAWASLPLLSTWPLPWHNKDTASDCSMPTSSDRHCPR